MVEEEEEEETPAAVLPDVGPLRRRTRSLTLPSLSAQRQPSVPDVTEPAKRSRREKRVIVEVSDDELSESDSEVLPVSKKRPPVDVPPIEKPSHATIQTRSSRRQEPSRVASLHSPTNVKITPVRSPSPVLSELDEAEFDSNFSSDNEVKEDASGSDSDNSGPASPVVSDGSDYVTKRPSKRTLEAPRTLRSRTRNRRYNSPFEPVRLNPSPIEMDTPLQPSVLLPSTPSIPSSSTKPSVSLILSQPSTTAEQFPSPSSVSYITLEDPPAPEEPGPRELKKMTLKLKDPRSKTRKYGHHQLRPRRSRRHSIPEEDVDESGSDYRPATRHNTRRSGRL